jgi:hypothetical protein
MSLHRDICDFGERSEQLANRLAVLLRPVSYSEGNPTGKPLHPEIVAGFHRVQVVARDLALNAEAALVSLSPRLRVSLDL